MKSGIKALGDFAIDIIETIVIAMSVFVVIYLLALQPHEVKGQSMDGLAGFHDGQYILTDKISYKLREPRRGEVIVFKYPLNKTFDYIKRIVAVPGDEVMLKDNKIYIFTKDNQEGFVLDESDYLADSVITQGRNFLKDGQKVSVQDGEYVVMGDNRSQSSDSRTWGFVNKDDIIGRSFFRYWPPNEIGFVEHPEFRIPTKGN